MVEADYFSSLCILGSFLKVNVQNVIILQLSMLDIPYIFIGGGGGKQ